MIPIHLTELAAVNAPIPPGWHADPWQQATYRWWDGTDWTSHVSGPPPRLQWDAALSVGAPVEQLDGLHRSAGMLRTTLLWAPVVQVLSLAAISVGYRQMFGDLFHNLDSGDATFRANAGGAWLAIGQLGSLVGIALTVLRMVFLYRAARFGGAAGVPARRQPGLACAGWIIPIVSLWFPYQDLRALSQGRAPVGSWWALYLIGTMVNVAAVFIGLWSPLVAGVLLVLCAALAVGAAVLERRVVATVVDVLVERVPS
jgi:hypothetical protein